MMGQEARGGPAEHVQGELTILFAGRLRIRTRGGAQGLLPERQGRRSARQIVRRIGQDRRKSRLSALPQKSGIPHVPPDETTGRQSQYLRIFPGGGAECFLVVHPQ